MFNTEPPAGARAVPGGECRSGQALEKGRGWLGAHCAVSIAEASASELKTHPVLTLCPLAS